MFYNKMLQSLRQYLVYLLLKFFNLFAKKTDAADAYRTITELIESRGFKCEEHEVTTVDGYILTLHRIVNPLVDRKVTPSRPILCQPGFGSNSSTYVMNADDGYLDSVADENMNRPKKEFDNNLGFLLAKRGYDVWLSNQRGTKYSMKHRTFDSQTDRAYWDYSLDEIIEHDFPAVIAYILNETKQKQMGYIGISLGSTQMFGLLSSQPEYNDIIKPFIALAPCYYLNTMESILRFVVHIIYKFRSEDRIMPAIDLKTEEVLKKFTYGHVFEHLIHLAVHFIISLLCGFNWKQVDFSRVPVYHAHAGHVIARKPFYHSCQYIVSDKGLRRFDFGEKKNIKIYGSASPPAYDLGKITNKHIAFIYGKNDLAASLKNVDLIRKSLKVPLFYDYLVPDNKWSHFDFLCGKDSGKVINSIILDILEKANEESFQTV